MNKCVNVYPQRRRLSLSGDELAGCMSACAALVRSGRRQLPKLSAARSSVPSTTTTSEDRSLRNIEQEEGGRKERLLKAQGSDPIEGVAVSNGPARASDSAMAAEHRQLLLLLVRTSLRAVDQFALALLAERGVRARQAPPSSRAAALQALSTSGHGSGSKSHRPEELLLPLRELSLDVATRDALAALGSPLSSAASARRQRLFAAVASPRPLLSKSSWADGDEEAAAEAGTSSLHSSSPSPSPFQDAANLVYVAAKLDVKVGGN